MSEIRDKVGEELTHIIWQAWDAGKNYSQVFDFQEYLLRERPDTKILSIPELAIVEDNRLDKERDTTVITRYRCNTCNVLYKKWMDAEYCCGRGKKAG